MRKFRWVLELVAQSPRSQFFILPWCLAVAFGCYWLIAYASTPGSDRIPLASWPTSVKIAREGCNSTLLMFIQPKCPCSAASLAELERLLAEIDSEPQLVFVLNCPAAFSREWSETQLARRCASIPGADMIVDQDGALADQFQASSSGCCLLYSPSGRLMFEGGITSARGHEGESFGRIALRQLLAGKSPTVERTPVFGCELIHCSQSIEIVAERVREDRS
jgi:hypothetical protein